MTIVAKRIFRLILTCLMPFKRCHLLFVYFLLYKDLRYILTSAVLEQVAKKRVPVLKKNPVNSENVFSGFLESKRQNANAKAPVLLRLSPVFLPIGSLFCAKVTLKCKCTRTTFVIAYFY